jgi:AraC-like DNA-binding protein/quercetin dioxygenase-like cupin family protein
MQMTVDGRMEWTKLYRILDDQLDAMHVRFVTKRYPRHAHEHYVIGIVRQGVQAYSYQNSKVVSSAGEVFVIDAEEPHTGHSATGASYELNLLYPTPRLFSRLAVDPGDREFVPHFKDATLRDPALEAKLLGCHDLIERGAPRAEYEACVLDALTLMAIKHAASPPRLRSRARESQRIRQARDFIEQNYAADISLMSLAALVGVSYHYFARAFEREVGLPPHTYIENVRVRKACELLRRGEPLVTTALEAGFGDQAHFTRRFKRFLGVTPGQYAKSRII